MQPRFYTFTRAFRSSSIWNHGSRLSFTPRISQFVCRTCRSKFSTSSTWREVAAAASKQAAKDVAKKAGGPKDKYPVHLVIYNAGDMRTTFVVFWKATAMFQFGVCAVFMAPMLYTNENQPDPDVRLLQAVGLAILGAVPMALMSYLTTPFVKRIAVQIPTFARQSRDHLMHFSSPASLPADTKLEFTTLRAFPYERKTAVYVKELRALPKQWWRFANIERVTTDEWRAAQRAKPFYRRVLEVLNEPRFKFYVKEGRNYTIKTGVPGVWENVAKAIQMQSEGAAGKRMTASGKAVLGVKNGKVAKPMTIPKEVRRVKRQTARSAK